MAAPDKDSHDIPQDVLEKLGDRYSAFEYISSGATSAVYKAHDAILDKTVALKVLKRAEEKDLIRFQKEARAASQLEHENLVHILDFNVTPSNNAFLIMEFVEGHDLDSILDEQGHLTIQLALSIAEKISLGMIHAHSKQIAHRDLKASNIIVCDLENPESGITVVDFGLAKKQAQDDTVVTQVGAELTTTSGVIQGSPLYMSPEQARGQEADERSDIYSLGCIIFKMLTGRTPFEAEDLLTLLRMQAEEPPPGLSEIDEERQFPEELETMVAKMLEKDPADRHQSMTEVMENLSAVKLSRPPAEHREDPETKSVSGRKSKVLALLSLFLLGMAGTYLYFNPIESQKKLEQKPVQIQQQGPSEEQLLTEKLDKMARLCQRTVNPYRDEGYHEMWYKMLNNRPMQREDFETLSLFLNKIAEKKQENNDMNIDHTRLMLQEIPLKGADLEILLASDIRALDLSRCTLDDTVFDVLPKFPDLKVLLLEGTGITNDQLKSLWTLQELDQLNLNNCFEISAPGFEGVEKSPKLRFIWLCKTIDKKKKKKVEEPPNEKIGYEVMKKLARCRPLEKIHADKTATDDSSIEVLFSNAVKDKNYYRELTLIDCKKITGKTMQLLAEKNPKIEGLEVAYTSVKPDDLKYLAAMKKLRILNVMGIPVDSKTLELIGKIESIENLYISELHGKDSDLEYLYHFKRPRNIFIFEAPGISSTAFSNLEKQYKKLDDFKVVAPNSQFTRGVEDMGDMFENMPF
ncbi:MAG: serine/threonine-protein kinase [Cyanobacteriota/Melainabacteria group bacterium]